MSLIQDLGFNLGLYSDYGLGVCALTQSQQELKEINLCRIFKGNNLQITAEANIKIVNFLDITLDLNTMIHKPYNKPNDKPIYVHNQTSKYSEQFPSFYQQKAYTPFS